ncbi:MAG: NAD(P)H-hydrate epimerase [Planctomycetaceae bacterium]
MEPLNRREARTLDRIAIEELGIPGLLLMENAGRGIAAAAREMLAGDPKPVLVTCGPGNNGGDGFAAARHLLAADVDVRVHLAAPAESHDPGSDAGRNLAMLRALRAPVTTKPRFRESALVVDALFGTGLTRPLEGAWAALVARINGAGVPVLAVDIPSGLDADTGGILGAAVRATVTATMVAPKAGFDRGEGPAHVGRVVVVGLGYPASSIDRARLNAGSGPSSRRGSS